MNKTKETPINSLVYILIYSTGVVFISMGIFFMLPGSLRYGYVMLGLVTIIGFAPLLIIDYKARRHNEKM